MNRTIASHLLKILLSVFIFIALLVMTNLPSYSSVMAQDNSGITYVVIPLLLYTELLLTLFIVGILLIIRILFMFDNNQVFTPKFVSILKILEKLCLFVSVSMLVVFGNIHLFVTPLGLVGAYVLVCFLLIAIVGAVIYLIRQVIMDGQKYKEENELVI